MRLAKLVATLLTVSLVAGACSGSDDDSRVVTAEFSRAVQVFPGNSVRVLGVTVGRVLDVENADGAVEVTMRLEDPDIKVPADVNATIIPVSLLGERYIQLFPAYEGGPELADGDVISLEQTSVPVEQDELLASLEDYFGALDPEKVKGFVESTAQVLRKNGSELNRLIRGGSQVVQTLDAKRDTLAELILEFDRLVTTLATRGDSIARVIRSYNAVVGNINANRGALEGTIAGLNQASLELASLLSAHRAPLDSDIDSLTKTARTLHRNVARFARTGHWAQRLFSAASRAVDYKRDWLRLGNQGGPLVELLEFRLRDRLVGVCLRLEIEDCQTPAFWAQRMPDLFCLDSSCPGSTSPGEALNEALDRLPNGIGDEVREGLGAGDKKRKCKDAKNPKRCRAKKKGQDVGEILDDLLDDVEDDIGNLPLDGLRGSL